MKRIISTILVFVLLSCVCSANALSSDISSTGERTLTDRSFNFDSLFSDWYGFERVYCHIREYNGDSLYEAFSDDELCVNNHDGIWSYDIKGKGIYLEPSKNYLLSFYTEEYKYKTHELFCSGKNLGHVAVCNQTIYEDPCDHNSYVHDICWTDSSDSASLLCITQTGNIIGHQLPDGVGMYDLFVAFLKNGVGYAAEITNRSVQKAVDDLAYSLGYGYCTVSEAINGAEIDIEWSAGDSYLEPRYSNSGNSASSESHWGSSHGISYTKPEDADSVPYILTDSGLIKTQKGQCYLYQCRLTTDEYISYLYGSVVFDHSGIIVNADKIPDNPFLFIFPYFQRNIKAYRTNENKQSISFSYCPSGFITLDQDTIVIQLYFIVTAESGIHQLYSSLHLEDEYKTHIDSKYYDIEESITPIEAEVPEAILGDADTDGEVTILDATAIQRDLAELPVTAFNAQAADADADGEISILDATSIQRHLAGLPSNENIGKPIK